MTVMRRAGVAATFACAVVVLAGCAVTAPAPAQTVFVTVPAAPTTSAATDAVSPPPPSPSTGVPKCQLTQLLVTADALDSTAGHFHYVLHFETPAASGDCSMDGFPIAQFTDSSDASGAFGPISTPDTSSSPSLVILHSAEVAHAQLTMVDPGVINCAVGPAT
ncbi:MAG: hypothetical protein ABUL47_06930, partial [Leifsonia sp.]